MLPVFSKLLERLSYMYNPFISNKKLLYKYQFGFQKGKSTHLALISLVEKITEVLGRGEWIIGFFLYFFKATVDIVLMKFEKYGINAMAHQ